MAAYISIVMYTEDKCFVIIRRKLSLFRNNMSVKFVTLPLCVLIDGTYFGRVIKVWAWSHQFSFCFYSANIAASLAVYSKVEERVVVGFLWSEVVSGDEIRWRLLAKCGHNVPPCMSGSSNLKAWSMKKEQDARQPSLLPRRFSQDQEMVVVNLWVIIDGVTWSLRISHGFP